MGTASSWRAKCAGVLVPYGPNQNSTRLSFVFLSPKNIKTQESGVLTWSVWEQNSDTLCTPRKSCSLGSSCCGFRVLVITETAGVTAWFCFVLGIIPAYSWASKGALKVVRGNSSSEAIVEVRFFDQYIYRLLWNYVLQFFVVRIS